MLSITLEGPPFERGFEHGRTFAQEIREEIRVFVPDRWRNAPEVFELERRLMSSLSQNYPELVLEMVGISKGAKIDFDQIALLNLVLATNDLESDSIDTTFKIACTAIGISNNELGPIVGKNCDERLSAAPFYVFQTIYPEEGMAFMGIANVGTVWMEGGINEAGLVLMQTAGPVAPDQNGYGVACNIVPRLLLARCRRTKQVINTLHEIFVAGWGMGLVLADAAGHLAVVEKTGGLCRVVMEDTDIAFCTNHFIAPEMTITNPISHDGLETNSKARYETLQTLYLYQAWPRTLAGLKEALGYHGEYGFVCQHGDADLFSNYSCIAIAKERHILLGDGYPCKMNYRDYLL